MYSVVILVTDNSSESVLSSLEHLISNYQLMPDRIILCIKNHEKQPIWQYLVEQNHLFELAKRLNSTSITLLKSDIICLLGNTLNVDHDQQTIQHYRHTLVRLYQTIISHPIDLSQPHSTSTIRLINIVATNDDTLAQIASYTAAFFSSQRDILLYFNDRKRSQALSANLSCKNNPVAHSFRPPLMTPAADFDMHPPLTLTLSIDKKQLLCAGINVPLSPANFAFYLMMAKDALKRKDGYECPPRDSKGCAELAILYIENLLAINGKKVQFHDLKHALNYCEKNDFSLSESVLHSLQQGLKYSTFNARKNEIWQVLKHHLPQPLAYQFRICSLLQTKRKGARRLVSRWGLSIAPEQISILK